MHNDTQARRFRRGGLFGAALLAALPVAGWSKPAAPAAAPAPAASAPSAPAATAAGPERTTSQFGDWSVTCTGQGTTRGCEMTSTVQSANRQASATVAVGRSGREAPMKLVVRVPLNVSVGQPLRLTLDGADAVAIPFRSCNPLGCFAELEMRDDAILRKLRARAADQPARVTWQDAAGSEAGFAVSFRGFTAAADALSRDMG